jgi:N-acetylglucosamine kinase-like BadF-type ATPase
VKYVIGIDSGGTKYRVLASSLEGKKLGGYEGSAGTHYALTREELLRRVNKNLDSCLAVFGGEREDCAYLVCGTTGLDSEEDGLFLNEFYGSLEGFNCPVLCINDAELAHYTVIGGAGVLVISGTGSIAFGRNRKGETARAGGWLFSIMGDEGSGSWVSRQALRQLGRWFDGAVPNGLLFRLIRESLKIATRKDLMDYSAKILRPPQSPQLGHLVDRAAAEGDAIAIGIAEAAAGETFGLVRDAVSTLGMEGDAELKIGLWGSNILNSPLHQGAFKKLAATRYPQAEILTPKRGAAEGAVEMALERLTNKKPGPGTAGSG